MRWFYLAIVIVFVAALIIFVFQNTQSVGISFLALSVTRSEEHTSELQSP